jgi:hypothetical protein
MSLGPYNYKQNEYVQTFNFKSVETFWSKIAQHT